MESVPPVTPTLPRRILVLQGGGALGAYQAGVYQALSRAGTEPDWVAGISIGAINAAIIAGNAPGERLKKLEDFWTLVTSGWPPASPFGTPIGTDLWRGALGDASVGW